MNPTGAYAATISTALAEALNHEAEAAAAAREAAARATAEKAALEATQAIYTKKLTVPPPCAAYGAIRFATTR
jgi:hypothetical protein